MRPRKPASTPQPDLFREALAAMIDARHELVRLARLIDWTRFDEAFGATLRRPASAGPACRRG